MVAHVRGPSFCMNEGGRNMEKSFNWHKAVEERWNSNVSFWSEKSRNMWEKGSRSTIVPFVEKHIESKGKIADIGCGDGYGSYKLNQAGFHVVGVDISPKMIDKAKEVQCDGLSFTVGDLAQLPFESDSLEGVVAINSIEWTEDPKQALQEIMRVIKPGGMLCLGLLGPTAGPRQNSYRRLYGEEVICNTMMPWEFENLSREMGWQVVDGHGVYKEEAKDFPVEQLPTPLKQALTFMWVFMLRK